MTAATTPIEVSHGSLPAAGGLPMDEESLGRVVEFHGHMCPGLAMGIRAALIALREIGPQSVDEEVVAVVETDMCGVDGIQFLTGCTFGKGNLVHQDWGKNAYTFYRRSDGRAIRISGLPDAWERDDDHQGLFSLVRSDEATDDEVARFRAVHVDKSYRVLMAPEDRLFTVTEVSGRPPRKARIHTSVRCAACGEPAMETRIRRFGGRELCIPCYEGAVAGN